MVRNTLLIGHLTTVHIQHLEKKKQGKGRRDKGVIFLLMNFIEQMYKLLHFLEEAD